MIGYQQVQEKEYKKPSKKKQQTDTSGKNETYDNKRRKRIRRVKFFDTPPNYPENLLGGIDQHNPDFEEFNKFFNMLVAENEERKNKKYSARYMCQIFDVVPMINSQYEHYVSTTQIKKAMEKGHYRANIWFYCNPLYFNKDFREDYKKNGRCEVYKAVSGRHSWVIDVDGFFKGHEMDDKARKKLKKEEIPCNSTEEMIDFMQNRGCTIPAMIVQTGLGRFHLYYTGTDSYWNDDRKRQEICRLAGVSEEITFDSSFHKTIYEQSDIHIDSAVSFRPGHDQCVRMPGSLNTMNLEDGVFVCKGWVNEYYNFENPDMPYCDKYVPRKPRECLDFRKNRMLRNKQDKVFQKVKDFYQDLVTEEVSEVLPRDTKAKRAVLQKILNNCTRLKRGSDFFLRNQKVRDVTPQSHEGLGLGVKEIAKACEVTNTRASKILQSLVAAGVLCIISDYEHPLKNPGSGSTDRKVRVYGFGMKIVEKIKEKQDHLYKDSERRTDTEGNYLIPNRIVDIIVLQLAEPYVSGEFNKMMLQDIRMMIQLGAENEEVSHFIMEKQANYSKRMSHRTNQDILRLCERWRTRLEYDEQYFYRKQSEISLGLYQRIMNKMEQTYDTYNKFAEQHRDSGGPVSGGYRLSTDRFYNM